MACQAGGITPQRRRDLKSNRFHIHHGRDFFTGFTFHSFIHNKIVGMPGGTYIQRCFESAGDSFAIEHGKAVREADARAGVLCVVLNITAFLLESPGAKFPGGQNMDPNTFYQAYIQVTVLFDICQPDPERCFQGRPHLPTNNAAIA